MMQVNIAAIQPGLATTFPRMHMARRVFHSPMRSVSGSHTFR